MALPALCGSGVQFRRILAHFPQELSLAFAYGSGVFRQAGATPSQSVVSGNVQLGWAGHGRALPCYGLSSHPRASPRPVHLEGGIARLWVFTPPHAPGRGHCLVTVFTPPQCTWKRALPG
uniref:Phosphatidate cytidylyltransferase n=1 Tax=Chelonoidis abingdonii TaxID=106734 RepID=A0A8C0H1M5_CHEAB